MKQKLVSIFILACITLTIAISAQSQDNFSLRSAKANIQGTSSLHDWESEITNIQCKGFFHVKNGVLKDVRSAEIKILVEGIKSTKGKMMDRKTYEAFKSDQHPYITFTFSSGQIAVDSENIATVEATGNLAMAGTTKAISLSAKMNVMANGDLQLSASKKIKMSDYKMEKPTAMLGTITVGDEVTLNFVLVLTPLTAQAKKI